MKVKRLAFRRVIVSYLTVLAFLLGAIAPSPALASHITDPHHVPDLQGQQPPVTVVGDLQSELGCPSDWSPSCTSTDLTLDPEDDIYQGVFNVPAGNFEYKAAIDHGGTENYGRFAQFNGPNIPLGG